VPCLLLKQLYQSYSYKSIISINITEACTVSAALFPHLHKNLMLALPKLRHCIASDSSNTGQKGCNVQPLLMHVYTGYRQTH
jgi:hypothetical protein